MTLNVDYVSSFLDAHYAEELLCSLLTYPFETRTIKVRGKSFTPTRQVCAFSDDGLGYTFSGISMHGKPWTPELLALKEQVELFTGGEYNYVLLNYYPEGNSAIGHHQDNEKDLDPSTPIATLSFGAEREIQFSRKGCPSIHYRLEHGSLLVMKLPTNQLYTHSILRDPSVTEPRISLTFRKIVLSSQKRELSDPSSSNKRLRLENDVLPSNDWLDVFLKENPTFPESTKEHAPLTLAGWPLKHNTFATVNYFRGKIMFHLREFVPKNNTHIPTKNGITISPESWYHFSERLCEENFKSLQNGANINNIFNLSPEIEGEHNIQFWTHLENGELELNQKFFKIRSDQLFELSKIRMCVTEVILEGMYNISLVHKILTNENHYLDAVIDESWPQLMKDHIRQSIQDELSQISCKITNCFFKDCLHNKSEMGLLLIDVTTLTERIIKHPCTFCLNSEFFKNQLSLEFYKQCCK